MGNCFVFLLTLALIVILGAILHSFFFKYVIRVVKILEYEKGIEYYRGKFKRLLGPGHYWIFAYFHDVVKVDMRAAIITITGQDILTSDGISLKISLAAKYEVTDPAIAVNKTENYRDALYLEVQLAARDVVGSFAIDDLLEKKSSLGEKITEIASKKVEDYGLKLHWANVKDLMFPAELREVFAKVNKAKKEGLAALERARGESAALRNLANSAQLMEKNPALMQLRILQAMGESKGNTFIMGLNPESVPLVTQKKNEQEQA